MFNFALTILILAAILLIGIPVGFGLGSASVLLSLVGDGFSLSFVTITILDSVNSFTLLAVPLFLIMSQILLVGKVGDNLFETVNVWVRHLPGGLAVATVFSCAIFAAITGSSSATAATIGTVAYPALLSRGYDKRFTCGLLSTGGVLGILIPPSIPMIIYSALTDSSLDKLFMAGMVPGVLLTFILAGYAVLTNWRSGHATLPKASASERWQLTRANLPAFSLPVIIIGGIYAGVFTPTEAAAVGLFVSLVLTMFVYRTITLRQLPGILKDAATTTCMIGMIIIGAHLFGKVMTFLSIPQELTNAVVRNEMSPLAFVLAINALLLVLGAFLETISCILLTTPLILPIMTALGIDPIWYGVVLTVNMTIALITPPVGMDLYVIKGLRDDIQLGDVIRGVVPFIILMFLFLALIIAVPGISTWLPSIMPTR